MWRNIYLMKLPGLERKIRVGLDWTLDLIFPPELSYLNLSRTQVINQSHFEAGDFIIHQGDVGDQFYVIVSGEVEVLKELPDGKTVQLTRLGQGEYFGETALLTGRRRNASVRASSPVDLMCLGRDEFNNLAGAWLKFSDSVQALSAERVQATSSDSEQSRILGTILARSMLGPRLAEVLKAPGNVPKGDGTPPTPYVPPPPPYLVRNDGAELRLEGDELHLGRAPDNHIVVNDKLVSRRHALLKREGTQYVLEDVGTPNGTHVNGQRVQRHLLAAGDTIRLGQTVFTYQVPVVEQSKPS